MLEVSRQTPAWTNARTPICSTIAGRVPVLLALVDIPLTRFPIDTLIPGNYVWQPTEASTPRGV